MRFSEKTENVFRFFSAYTFSNAGPKFLDPSSCYNLNFFLLERACQDAEHDEAFFLIKLCFYYYNDTYINRLPFSESFLTPSICQFFFHIKSKILKKRASSCSGCWYALSNKTKIKDIAPAGTEKFGSPKKLFLTLVW